MTSLARESLVRNLFGEVLPKLFEGIENLIPVASHDGIDIRVLEGRSPKNRLDAITREALRVCGI